MRSLAIAFAFAIPLAAQTVLPPFNQHMTARDIGPINATLGWYGGITFLHNNPNVLLFAPYTSTTIYAVPVTRDGMGHINGFGTPATHATLTDGADGGLAYGPNNVLFHTSYPGNLIGEVLPGSPGTNRTLDLNLLSNFTMASVGGCAFVPAGYPGAGQFKVVSWGTADWRTVGLAPEPSGTYGATGISAQHLIGGGPEGILYPGPTTAWTNASRVLIADWSNNTVRVMQIDANGDPIPSSDAVLVGNVPGVGGGALDPVTGDWLFTFSNGRLLQIRQGGTCGSFRVYGTGGAGLNGVPTIAATGCARLAGSFTVAISNGRPNAFGALAIGFSEWQVPVFNFELLNDGAISLSHVLNGTGAYSLPVAVPSTALYGNWDIYFQGGYLDAATPFGFAASRGLQVHID